MRHLQLKRSNVIYDNRQLALDALKTQATAMYRDTTSTTARVMRDGEPILASYRDDNAPNPNKVADILALLIKKDDGTDALFYIDSQDILNKIGIKVDVDFNSLWLTKLDSGEKTPIVVESGETTTVIDAINDLAKYIVEVGKNNGKIEGLQEELDKTQELTIGFNSSKDTDAPFTALTDAKITSGATSLIDAVKKIDDTIIENERISSGSLNDLNTGLADLSGKTLTELYDTNTIDFNVTSAEDGTLKGNGSVKISSDVEGNLLKVSGDTGLYVSKKDIQAIQTVAGAVDEIEKTTDKTKFGTSANTFTVKYANGKSDAIHQITYDSAMPDNLTTPSQNGGIEKGTTVQSLNGMALSKILDMILFPEIFPTLSAPSVGLNQGSGSYEVGTTFPTFTISTNRGKVTCPGQSDRYQLGTPTKTAIYTGTTSSASHTTEAETLPTTVGYGTIYVKGYAEFAQGDELKTSYGKIATKDVNGNKISQNPHPASAMTGGASSVRGFYKYGGNMGSIDTIAKANAEAANNKGNNVVKNGATVYDSALIVDYKSKEASKAGGLVDGNGGYVLALPSIMNITMRDVLQFNSGSGSWDASVKGDWEVFTPTSEDRTKFPGTLTDAAGNTYSVTYFKHKADSTALDGTGAARVSFAFVW